MTVAVALYSVFREKRSIDRVYGIAWIRRSTQSLRAEQVEILVKAWGYKNCIMDSTTGGLPVFFCLRNVSDSCCGKSCLPACGLRWIHRL